MDDQCVICGTAEGDSISQITLMTNAVISCGHQFCPSCIDREFGRRREFPCPVCETVVKKVHLTQRSLDDVQCERDTSWRRRVLSVFNKRREDFQELQEYNDYLEKAEDMIYAIVNEMAEAEGFKEKLRQYEEENRSAINQRQSQRADAAREIQDQIVREQRDQEDLRAQAAANEEYRKHYKKRLRQEEDQVQLGEREEVSAEVRAAQMNHYRQQLKHARREVTPWVSPRVREPAKGLDRDRLQDREMYRKRQAAGGGVVTGSIVAQEWNWKQTLSSLLMKEVK